MNEIIHNSLFKRGVIKRNQSFLELPLKESFNNNVFKLGHFLLDVHETMGINEFKFNLMNPFETFETFPDIVNYFENLEEKKEHTA